MTKTIQQVGIRDHKKNVNYNPINVHILIDFGAHTLSDTVMTWEQDPPKDEEEKPLKAKAVMTLEEDEEEDNYEPWDDEEEGPGEVEEEGPGEIEEEDKEKDPWVDELEEHTQGEMTKASGQIQKAWELASGDVPSYIYSETRSLELQRWMETNLTIVRADKKGDENTTRRMFLHGDTDNDRQFL